MLAASSLTDAMKEIAAGYEKANPGERVVLDLAGSNALQLQIEHGARADVFLPADEARMDALAAKGLIDASSRIDLLSNSLVVIVPGDRATHLDALRQLAAQQFRRIALADPSVVPAGVYARKALETAGIWNDVAPRVVPAVNVRAALAAVEWGAVDAGMVYRTDAILSSRVVIAFEVPPADSPSIVYPAAVVERSDRPEAARRFLAWLRSPASAATFRKFGFGVAGAPPG